MLYSNLEQLCIACRKYTLTEDDVSALTSGGRNTHACLSVCDIDEEHIDLFIQNSTQLKFFFVDLHVSIRTYFDYYEKIKRIRRKLNVVANFYGLLTYKLSIGDGPPNFGSECVQSCSPTSTLSVSLSDSSTTVLTSAFTINLWQSVALEGVELHGHVVHQGMKYHNLKMLPMSNRASNPAVSPINRLRAT